MWGLSLILLLHKSLRKCWLVILDCCLKLGPVASEHRSDPLPAGVILLRLTSLSWKSCCCGPRKAERRWIYVVHDVLLREKPWLASLSTGLCPGTCPCTLPCAGQGFSTGPPSPAGQSFTSGIFYLLSWACEIMVRGEQCWQGNMLDKTWVLSDISRDLCSFTVTDTHNWQ